MLAPYKEIPVVYGLLNASDSLQYIRIQKAFLGEGNALIMAQHTDSIYYRDILDVKLEEYNNSGIKLRTLSLIRDQMPKEPGNFSTFPNYIYRTQGEKLNTQFDYKLVVRNTETDSMYSAQTLLVDSISILNPTVFAAQLSWVAPFPYTVRYSPNSEGFIYQLIIRFHYSETTISTGNVSWKYIDWKFPERTKQESGEININRPDFYTFVASQLDPDQAVKRHAGEMEFIFTIAAEQFKAYIDVNNPPTGVNQEVPMYTNIQGGLGIFSSRMVQVVGNKYLDVASEAELVSGAVTGDLGFE